MSRVPPGTWTSRPCDVSEDATDEGLCRVDEVPTDLTVLCGWCVYIAGVRSCCILSALSNLIHADLQHNRSLFGKRSATVLGRRGGVWTEGTIVRLSAPFGKDPWAMTNRISSYFRLQSSHVRLLWGIYGAATLVSHKFSSGQRRGLTRSECQLSYVLLCSEVFAADIATCRSMWRGQVYLMKGNVGEALLKVMSHSGN